jgi:flagellar basal body L-ring protein FlgH
MVGDSLMVTVKEAAEINRVAATVVDILPNGVLVLAAHKWIVDNNDLWAYMLTGKVDPKRVSDGSVLSENIADLIISKQLVHVSDCIGPF